MAIDPISAKVLTSAIQQKPAAGGMSPDGLPQGAAASFTDSLKQLLESVNDTTGDANVAVNNMVSGTGDVHHAMLALQRAEETFELTVQVRNKLVAAYQDVMKMPM